MSKRPQFDLWNPYRSIHFVPSYEAFNVYVKQTFVGSFRTLDAAMKARKEYEATL